MIACIGGCIGFAIVANCRGWIILYSGIGALITRVTYLISLKLADGNYFTATLMAACGAAFFANLLSLIINTPPSIFLTTFILPVIPSSTLYLTVYAIIMDDRLSYHENGRRLFLVCVAIALGFIIVEVMFKYGIMILRKLKQES